MQVLETTLTIFTNKESLAKLTAGIKVLNMLERASLSVPACPLVHPQFSYQRL